MKEPLELYYLLPPIAQFFYPLKALESRKVFQCVQGVEKGRIRIELVKWSNQ